MWTPWLPLTGAAAAGAGAAAGGATLLMGASTGGSGITSSAGTASARMLRSTVVGAMGQGRCIVSPVPAADAGGAGIEGGVRRMGTLTGAATGLFGSGQASRPLPAARVTFADAPARPRIPREAGAARPRAWSAAAAATSSKPEAAWA
jgi:hypothetical protein